MIVYDKGSADQTALSRVVPQKQRLLSQYFGIEVFFLLPKNHPWAFDEMATSDAQTRLVFDAQTATNKSFVVPIPAKRCSFQSKNLR